MHRPQLAGSLAPAHVVTDPAALLAFHQAVFGDSTMTSPTPPAPPAPAPPATPAPPADPPADPPRTFTQDEVNRLTAREKDQGERAERRKIAESLGLDPESFDPATVKAALDAQRERDRASESEAERLRREAAEDRAAAAAEKAAAQAERLAGRRTAALTDGGLVLPTDADERRAALNQAAALLDIAPDASDDDVRTAVDQLKARFPGLFTTSTTPPKVPPAPSGGPTGTPPRAPAPAGDAFDRGAERAKRLAGSIATT